MFFHPRIFLLLVFQIYRSFLFFRMSDGNGEWRQLLLDMQEIVDWLSRADQELMSQQPIGSDITTVQQQNEKHEVKFVYCRYQDNNSTTARFFCKIQNISNFLYDCFNPLANLVTRLDQGLLFKRLTRSQI